MDGQTLLQRCEDASKKEVKKFFRKEKKREIFPTLFWCFPEDGRTDGQTQGWTDRPSYRDAWTHLKIFTHFGHFFPQITDILVAKFDFAYMPGRY